MQHHVRTWAGFYREESGGGPAFPGYAVGIWALVTATLRGLFVGTRRLLRKSPSMGPYDVALRLDGDRGEIGGDRGRGAPLDVQSRLCPRVWLWAPRSALRRCCSTRCGRPGVRTAERRAAQLVAALEARASAPMRGSMPQKRQCERARPRASCFRTAFAAPARRRSAIGAHRSNAQVARPHRPS